MYYINLVIVGILSYIFSIILGPIVIDYFKRQSVKQVVREEGLESHYKKTGTPTMGGFIFLIPSLLITTLYIIFFKEISIEIILIIFSTIFFGAIGFIDDYNKVVKKHNEGLTAKQKLVAQLLVGIPLAIVASMISTELWIPFTDIYLDLGYFYGVLVLIAVLATTNAVNLTDGVDGLSTSVTILVLAFITFLSIKLDVLNISIFSVTLLSGLLGFLLYNKNPAKIFMGDIGSLALGGAVVSLFIFTNTLLLIPFAGVIYVGETLSVTIQVAYFKKTKKRIFRMTPIHHHYELVGWNEKKIVKVFSIVTIIGIIISIFSLIKIL